MRSLVIVASLLALAGCGIPGAPAGYAESGWRTASGAALTVDEVAALQPSCGSRGVVTAIDPDRPVADPSRDNPAYHPGGEGLANAPATGIAAPDRPVAPATRQLAPAALGSLDECLSSRGLVRAP